MKKYVQNKLNNEKGMTLIELLAVIVIIAIIAAIAIPAIGNIIDNSRVGAVKSDGQNALQAAELLLIDNPKFIEGASGKKIILTDLTNGYLDDAGSFKNDGTFEITRVDGKLVLTGVGTVGSVKVTFTKAGKGIINGLKNNAKVGVAGDISGTTPSTAEVTAR